MSDVVTLEPPATHTPNWDLAKVLYSQGVASRVICAQCHVTDAALRKRASRGEWSRLRADLVSAVTVQLSETKPIAPASQHVAQIGEQIREDLVAGYQKATHAIKSLKPPKSLVGLANWASVLRDLCQPGKVLFGWGESITSSLSIGLLKSAIESAQPLNANLKPELPEACRGLLAVIKQNDTGVIWRLVNDSATVPEWRAARDAIAKATNNSTKE